MPILGAATKQTFTYGKRGRRPAISSENYADSESNSDEDAPIQPKLIPASRARREKHTARTPSPPKMRKVPLARRPIAFASPRMSPKVMAKAKGVKFPRPSSTSQAKPSLSLATARTSHPAPEKLPSAPLLSRTAPKTLAPRGTPLAALGNRSSPTKDVQILTLDKHGREINQGRFGVKSKGSSDFTRATTGGLRVSRLPDLSSGKNKKPSTFTTHFSSLLDNESAPLSGSSKLIPVVNNKVGNGINRGKSSANPILLTDSEDDEQIPDVRPVRRNGPRARRILPDSSSDSELDLSCRQKQAIQSVPLFSQPPLRDVYSEPAVPPKQYKQADFAPEPLSLAQKPKMSTPPRARVSASRKPRQLTPTVSRYGRNPIFPRPPSPPTPETLSDIDLSQEFASLAIDVSFEERDTREDPASIPGFLSDLLAECDQKSLQDFHIFIETFSSRIDPHTGLYSNKRDAIPSNITHRRSKLHFQKIGEASYSEVFGIGSVVLKIIPLCDEIATKTEPREDDPETPLPTNTRDVLNEIVMTRTINEVCGGGFIQLLDAHVVRGCYPPSLLALWDEYENTNGSESIRPDSFHPSQPYAIIILPDGGSDLETYTFATPSTSGWRQACAIFWKVARTLAQAEELVRFEHRDLHWGQVLIQDLPSKVSTLEHIKGKNRRSHPNRIPMDDKAHGIEVTLIDLGLARMETGEGKSVETLWTPFDDETFDGKGDYQFEVYRMMRTHNGNSWEEYRPLTNVMWLHYLVLKLIHFKRLRTPSATRTSKLSHFDNTTNFSERECYECLIHIEEKLGAFLSDQTTEKKKLRKSMAVRRQTLASSKLFPLSPGSVGPTSAGDVVQYGISQGWLVGM